MPAADIDWSILKKIDIQEVCDMIIGNNYTGTHSIDEPEYEVIGLSLKQKMALEWIIFKVRVNTFKTQVWKWLAHSCRRS